MEHEMEAYLDFGELGELNCLVSGIIMEPSWGTEVKFLRVDPPNLINNGYNLAPYMDAGTRKFLEYMLLKDYKDSRI